MTVRVSGKPIELPKGVSVSINKDVVSVKGPKGELSLVIPEAVEISVVENAIHTKPVVSKDNAFALAGTIRARLNNNVNGVEKGFSKKLKLIGVGFRVAVSKEGNLAKVNLSIGFSHPVIYVAPEGIEFKSETQTDLEVIGVDKQLVGQVAADIRSYRPPEPYKGKGIRYADEVVVIKETKKQ